MEEILPTGTISIAIPKKRVGAFVIDDLVISFLFLAIFWEAIASLHDPVEISQFVTDNFLIIASIKILYHTFFVWQNGMTLGKYIMKIRVVTLQNEQTPSLPTALARAVVRVASEIFFYIGFAMAFFNPLVQTLHDKLTQCVVVDA